jgi:hypothetical protein
MYDLPKIDMDTFVASFFFVSFAAMPSFSLLMNPVLHW